MSMKQFEINQRVSLINKRKKCLLQMLDFIGTKHYKHTQSILQSTIDFKKKFVNKWKSTNQ